MTINGVKTIVEWDLRELSIAPMGVNPGTTFALASTQVGKAFGDELSEVERLRHERDTLIMAGDLLDRIGLRLDVLAMRERVRA